MSLGLRSPLKRAEQDALEALNKLADAASDEQLTLVADLMRGVYEVILDRAAKDVQPGGSAIAMYSQLLGPLKILKDRFDECLKPCEGSPEYFAVQRTERHLSRLAEDLENYAAVADPTRLAPPKPPGPGD